MRDKETPTPHLTLPPKRSESLVPPMDFVLGIAEALYFVIAPLKLALFLPSFEGQTTVK